MSPLTLLASAPSWAQSTHPPLRFPVDFGAHPASGIEWWYVTGSLRAEGAAKPITHGFQITFFRSSTGLGAGSKSRFAARELIFAHAALTDLRDKHLRHDQRIARTGFEIARAAEGNTAIALRDWSMQRSGGAGASRYVARVASDTARFTFDFTFTATQPVLLQGDNGFSRKGPRDAQSSFYYSEPQLAVSGTLIVDGKPSPVVGTAWLDHEWSDALLDADAVGWDWIGMNLDDGSALTAFRMRRADGGTLFAGGSFRARGGATADFASAPPQFEPLRWWTSASSRARYPVAWRISTPVGRFTVQALLDDQELDSRASTGAIYWEGLSELLDERGTRVGVGYLELTGYAAPLKL